MRKVAEFVLDGVRDSNLAELRSKKIQMSDDGKVTQTGEVLLATSIRDVLLKLPVSVMPRDASLARQFPEDHSLHLGKFGRFPESAPWA